jgi:hypothetical protein
VPVASSWWLRTKIQAFANGSTTFVKESKEFIDGSRVLTAGAMPFARFLSLTCQILAHASRVFASARAYLVSYKTARILSYEIARY